MPLLKRLIRRGCKNGMRRMRNSGSNPPLRFHWDHGVTQITALDEISILKRAQTDTSRWPLAGCLTENLFGSMNVNNCCGGINTDRSDTLRGNPVVKYALGLSAKRPITLPCLIYG